MTFAVGHVQGGTNAGRKRPLREKPGPWVCGCSYQHGYVDEHTLNAGWTPPPMRSLKPGYLTRCTDCKTERP